MTTDIVQLVAKPKVNKQFKIVAAARDRENHIKTNRRWRSE